MYPAMTNWFVISLIAGHCRMSHIDGAVRQSREQNVQLLF